MPRVWKIRTNERKILKTNNLPNFNYGDVETESTNSADELESAAMPFKTKDILETFRYITEFYQCQSII